MFYKKTIITALFGLAVLAAPALAKDNSKAFLKKVSHHSVTHIHQAEVALKMAKNPDMQAFAKMQIEDHKALKAKLWPLAEKNSVAVTDSVTVKEQRTLDKLMKMNDRNREFDREYLKMVLADHRKAIKVLKKQSKSGTDAEVRAFAAEALPVYQKHWDEANGLYGRLNTKREE